MFYDFTETRKKVQQHEQKLFKGGYPCNGAALKIVQIEDWLTVYSTYCRLVPFPRKTKVAICWRRGTKMRTHLRLVYYDWLFRWKWAPLQLGHKSIKCLEIVSKLLSFYGITFLLGRMVRFFQYITLTDHTNLESKSSFFDLLYHSEH